MLLKDYSSWPSYSVEEADAVRSVLLSNRVNYWTGEETRVFETEFAAWGGVQKAIALTNGTVALDLALNALEIGKGDEVIVTPRTFIASVSSVVNAGAIPVFADVDYESGNITASTIEAVMSPRTKAIVPVHLAGWPTDMPEIMDIARAVNAVVIEDCAQAHGAAINGKMVGSFGHVGAWSFCQDKIMTTGGEGGMVTTDDEDLWSRMWSFKDHGKSWDAVYNRTHAPGFRWLHESFGTNWRMLEMQAVIGRIQLKKMAEWTARRTAIAAMIGDMLAGHKDVVRVPATPSHATHAYYRLYAYVRPEGLKDGWTRDRIVTEVTGKGAPLLQGSCSEVYLEKAFDSTSWRPEKNLPVAQELGATSLMFLTHPNLQDGEIARICEIVSDVLKAAKR